MKRMFLVWLLALVAGTGLVVAGDNFLRGATFDGLEGQLTGEYLEDLITRASLVQNDSGTNRIYDNLSINLSSDSPPRLQVKDGGITSNKYGSASIPAGAYGTNSIPAWAYGNQTIRANALATNSIGASNIQYGAVGASNLAAGAVSFDKLAPDVTQRVVVVSTYKRHLGLWYSISKPRFETGWGRVKATGSMERVYFNKAFVSNVVVTVSCAGYFSDPASDVSATAAFTEGQIYQFDVASVSATDFYVQGHDVSTSFTGAATNWFVAYTWMAIGEDQ